MVKVQFQLSVLYLFRKLIFEKNYGYQVMGMSNRKVDVLERVSFTLYIWIVDSQLMCNLFKNFVDLLNLPIK